MKKFIKRSLILVCAIYLLLSFVINIYFVIQYNSKIKEYGVMDNNEMKEERVSIPSNTDVEDLIQMNHYSGRLEVVREQFKIVIISAFLGILISMCTLLKENAKLKYVLFFMIGNIIFNLFCTLIAIFVFSKNGIELGFEESYIEVTKYTFILYVITYFIFLMIAFMDMKIKIKKINKSIGKE